MKCLSKFLKRIYNFIFLGLCVVFPFLEGMLAILLFQSIVSMFRGLASMEKTVDHCNIFVDELDWKLVLVFHCKHKKMEDKNREKEREKGREKNAGKEMGMLISLNKNFCAHIKGLCSQCWRQK